MKTLIIGTTLITSLMTLPLAAQSQASQQAETQIAKEYRHLFSSIEHLQVDFTQTVYKKLRDRTVNRQGKAYFSKPAKFRWNFESDKFGNEEFYFDGKTLTHYKEKDQLVTHYKANVGLARELREVVNFVLDPTNLFDRYQIKDLTRKDQLTTIDLIPRAETSTDVQQVQVTVVDRSRYVRRVKIIYADGNYTQFTFRNPVEKTNQPELFRFTRQGNFTVRSHG